MGAQPSQAQVDEYKRIIRIAEKEKRRIAHQKHLAMSRDVRFKIEERDPYDDTKRHIRSLRFVESIQAKYSVIPLLETKDIAAQRLRRDAIMFRRQIWLDRVMRSDRLASKSFGEVIEFVNNESIHSGLDPNHPSENVGLRISDPGGWHTPMPVWYNDPLPTLMSEFMNKPLSHELKLGPPIEYATIVTKVKRQIIIVLHRKDIDIGLFLFNLAVAFKDSRMTEVYLVSQTLYPEMVMGKFVKPMGRDSSTRCAFNVMLTRSHRPYNGARSCDLMIQFHNIDDPSQVQYYHPRCGVIIETDASINSLDFTPSRNEISIVIDVVLGRRPDLPLAILAPIPGQFGLPRAPAAPSETDRAKLERPAPPNEYRHKLEVF